MSFQLTISSTIFDIFNFRFSFIFHLISLEIIKLWSKVQVQCQSWPFGSLLQFLKKIETRKTWFETKLALIVFQSDISIKITLIFILPQILKQISDLTTQGSSTNEVKHILKNFATLPLCRSFYFFGLYIVVTKSLTLSPGVDFINICSPLFRTNRMRKFFWRTYWGIGKQCLAKSSPI